ncbi:SDR family oxidoreductase [Dactylosporangium sp. NPDC005572]|uniref:SDR family NAD(P)-dependent oxidoreductase n=1 Tax=Dactylosporangium sp. NPDC005572 TaxID=3156889 RepID=UPI00339EBFA5
MSGLLDGKVVVVTGASVGIGADAARVFAREGASLVLGARGAEALEALAAELRDGGAKVAVSAGDVSVAADVERLVGTAVETFGRLDGAFNNAGMTQFGRLDEVPEADFDRLFAVNVKGVWLCMRAQVRAMTATAGGGSIVNNSSVGGYRGSSGLGAYQGSKHAVIGLSRTAAHDFGPLGVRVNVVAPGATETAMFQAMRETMPEGVARRIAAIPLGRAADPADVGEAAAWLLSDRARHITGVVLPVDGGFSA